MAHFAQPGLERPAAYELPRRHRWLAASAGVHLLLAIGLYTAGPVRIEHRREQGVQARVEQSLRETERRQMRRQLRTMEEIKEALEQSAGIAPPPDGPRTGKPGPDARGRAPGKAPENARAQAPAEAPEKESAKAPEKAPEQRARELMQAIERVQQQVRAAELARLLRIPEHEALRRVQREAARQPRAAVLPKNPSPQAVVARLTAQARGALAQRRAQLQAQQQGVAVKGTAPRGGARVAAAGAGQGGHAMQSGQPGHGPRGDARTAGVGSGQGGGAAQAGIASAALGGRLDALAAGLEMEAPGVLTGSSLDMSSTSFSDQRGYGGYLRPPALDAARVRAGGGRKLGPGGAWANRIHLDTWYVIGPFEGQGAASIQTVYPPERGVDLDAVYYGKNDLPVRWTWQQDATYPSVPLPRAEHAVYYAYTEVEVDRDVDLWMSIGADDDSKIWFNDRLVWISGNGDKPWYRQPFQRLNTEIATRNLAEGQRKLHFRKGRNTILFKLYNGTNLMFFSVVLSPAAS